MRYLGGKARIAKALAAEIARYRRPGQPVWEPFCGGLNSAVAHGGIVHCTDACVPLIALLQAVRDGWDPPTSVTREEYHAARLLPETDPMHGFAGFCSFGARLWAGYARTKRGADDPSTYAMRIRRALLRDAPLVSSIELLDFTQAVPGPTDRLIYCDPPYEGRTKYRDTLDHERFRELVVAWSRYTTVMVSGYDFPLGELVWEKTRAAKLRGKEKTHTERLYLCRDL